MIISSQTPRSLFCLLLFAAVFGSLPLQAATTLDWSPTAGTTAWATGSNWVGGASPTSDLTTHIARFNQTGYTNQPNYGTTSINGLIFGDGSTSSAATTLSGTTLSLGNGGITVNANAGAITLDGAITLGANQTWSNHSANTLTVNASITGSNLTKAGTGTVTFTGASSINTNLIINGGGAVNISGASAIWSGVPNLTMGSGSSGNTLTISGGATLTTYQVLIANNNFNNNTVTATGSGTTWTIGYNSDFFDRGTGNTFNIQAGAAVTSSAINYFGYFSNATSNSILVDGASSVWNTSTLDLANQGSSNTITISNAGTINTNGGVTLGVNGAASNNSVTITGTGSSWKLNNNNLSVGGGSGNAINVSSGGDLNNINTLTLGGTNAALNLGNGTGISTTSMNLVNLSAASSRLNFNSGRLTARQNGALVQGAGEIVLNGAAYVSTTFAASTITNVISGAGSLTKEGAGQLTLSGASTYTGATIISAGTLQIGNGGTSGSLSTSSAITNNATLVFNRSNTVAQGTDFASVIDGTGAVTQAGGGALVLTGANTYSGATTVSSGSIVANNTSGSATGSGALVVNSGSVLSGTGRVNTGTNAITLNGTLTLGDTTLGSVVRTDLELGTTGGSGITLGATGVMQFDLFSGAGSGDNTASLTANDLLILYGDISLLSGASLLIDNPNNMSAWAIGDQWRLWDVTNAGTRSGSFALANIIAPLLSGGGMEWSFNSNTGILSIVPEPGRATLLFLGLCAALFRRRRP